MLANEKFNDVLLDFKYVLIVSNRSLIEKRDLFLTNYIDKLYDLFYKVDKDLINLEQMEQFVQNQKNNLKEKVLTDQYIAKNPVEVLKYNSNIIAELDFKLFLNDLLSKSKEFAQHLKSILEAQEKSINLQPKEVKIGMLESLIAFTTAHSVAIVCTLGGLALIGVLWYSGILDKKSVSDLAEKTDDQAEMFDKLKTIVSDIDEIKSVGNIHVLLYDHHISLLNTKLLLLVERFTEQINEHGGLSAEVARIGISVSQTLANKEASIDGLKIVLDTMVARINVLEKAIAELKNN